MQASKWIAYITVKPQLGKAAAHNSKVVYSLDFRVTPHQLRHTYITNLIHASVDPKTVQYLAGHEKSKITMDIYAKVKYNRPEQLLAAVNRAFGTAIQLSLFSDEKSRERHEKLDRTMDIIRGRYGYTSLQRAIVYTDHQLGRINPTEHTIHPVGYFCSG